MRDRGIWDVGEPLCHRENRDPPQGITVGSGPPQGYPNGIGTPPWKMWCDRDPPWITQWDRDPPKAPPYRRRRRGCRRPGPGWCGRGAGGWRPRRAPPAAAAPRSGSGRCWTRAPRLRERPIRARRGAHGQSEPGRGGHTANQSPAGAGEADIANQSLPGSREGDTANQSPLGPRGWAHGQSEPTRIRGGWHSQSEPTMSRG